jgi:hypothetical protein
MSRHLARDGTIVSSADPGVPLALGRRCLALVKMSGR